MTTIYPAVVYGAVERAERVANRIALQAAISVASDGDEIVLSDGQLQIEFEAVAPWISVDKSVAIRGTGKDSTVIKPFPRDDSLAWDLFRLHASDVSFADFTVIGPDDVGHEPRPTYAWRNFAALKVTITRVDVVGAVHTVYNGGSKLATMLAVTNCRWEAWKKVISDGVDNVVKPKKILLLTDFEFGLPFGSYDNAIYPGPGVSVRAARCRCFALSGPQHYAWHFFGSGTYQAEYQEFVDCSFAPQVTNAFFVSRTGVKNGAVLIDRPAFYNSGRCVDVGGDATTDSGEVRILLLQAVAIGPSVLVFAGLGTKAVSVDVVGADYMGGASGARALDGSLRTGDRYSFTESRFEASTGAIFASTVGAADMSVRQCEVVAFPKIARGALVKRGAALFEDVRFSGVYEVAPIEMKETGRVTVSRCSYSGGVLVR